MENVDDVIAENACGDKLTISSSDNHNGIDIYCIDAKGHEAEHSWDNTRVTIYWD